MTRKLKPSLGISLLVACLLGCSDSGSNPTSPPPPSQSGPPMVGILGCSQTTSAWRGWIDLADGRVWSLFAGYGGGDIAEWARSIPGGDYWGRLEANIGGNPPATAIWWQICDLARDNGTRADAMAVLEEIRRRLPDAVVFVSPLADFERPQTCTKQDIANSRLLTDHVVAAGNARHGPELPMVLDRWIQPPAGNGRCGMGDEGAAAFGSALAGFPWPGPSG